ncbi:hypothetical protein [Endozoicomonas euniceicola]|uniref:Uncharacterized protein n=1 Tax=Endozoicomonas euniceicola TaxID=1234143 RepID=A0ABY6H353_9GAMM|nr:hypothetical protein [Endozoicomonas euniceicola]UYM18671.1 hypothetical protein NX720_12455 [Endozoicomonas euniceicola]
MKYCSPPWRGSFRLISYWKRLTVDDVLDNQFWPELWPIHARQDGLDDLRKQPWFVQEIRRAIDKNETPDYPPFALKKAL